ncbi:MAG: 1-(5-phosphoribosyl)-5-[(5-phosphoribosylamino)methylideneamino]imidazole-4-carboxamide isomerase [Deltaproteobacteria bacterium]|nr:1-(5-phosphoribosyl)-5-[(5-phosphoribosylamino)methylideneamino]imidazole-4-carboxamide isomerase [Deltaproteobacteria bacterium]
MFVRFKVIPAIDLKGGEVVRLHQGDMARATFYDSDPALVAESFAEQGAELIHVVDLDGAIAGAPRNLDAIRKIRRATKCQIDFSGGLRSIESITEATAAGADFISIGSAALLNPDLLKRACAELPGRVFGSVDVRDGQLVLKGWVQISQLLISEAIARFQEAGVASLIVTDVSRDGTQEGSDVAFFAELASSSHIPVIASGGVANLEDIRALRRRSADGIVGVIVGRALYERHFTLRQALSAADTST